MSLATRLNQLRIKKGVSLQDVADRIGASKTHVWELEKGKSENPSLEMLTKLADYFGTSIGALIGEEIDSAGDNQLMKMFRQVESLTPIDRSFLDDTIQNLIKRSRERDDSNRSDGN